MNHEMPAVSDKPKRRWYQFTIASFHAWAGRIKGMLRFSIRELLLVMAVVGLATAVAMQNWTHLAPGRFSRRDLEVYGATIQHEFVRHGSDGLIFVSLEGQDPPISFAGQVALRASQAQIAIGPESLKVPQFPARRFRAISDGSPGVLFALRIRKWIATDCVEVSCDVLVSDNIGWGEVIILRLKNGSWHYESTSDQWDV